MLYIIPFAGTHLWLELDSGPDTHDQQNKWVDTQKYGKCYQIILSAVFIKRSKIVFHMLRHFALLMEQLQSREFLFFIRYEQVLACPQHLRIAILSKQHFKSRRLFIYYH